MTNYGARGIMYTRYTRLKASPSNQGDALKETGISSQEPGAALRSFSQGYALKLSGGRRQVTGFAVAG